jgi:hypothetical protein
MQKLMYTIYKWENRKGFTTRFPRVPASVSNPKCLTLPNRGKTRIAISILEVKLNSAYHKLSLKMKNFVLLLLLFAAAASAAPILSSSGVNHHKQRSLSTEAQNFVSLDEEPVDEEEEDIPELDG